MPRTAFLFSFGSVALMGIPPSVIFISEFSIILQSIKNGYYWITVLLIGFLIAAFVALLSKTGSMVFGKADEDFIANTGDFPPFSYVPMLLPVIASLILGFYIPGSLYNLLIGIVHIIR
jgi:hydrogenase-4 component F